MITFPSDPVIILDCDNCDNSQIVHPQRTDTIKHLKTMTSSCACGGTMRCKRGVIRVQRLPRSA